MSDIVTRLRKLLALANDSDSPESRKAREIYEKLLDQHGVAREDVDDTLVRNANYRSIPSGTRCILIAVCRSLGVTIALAIVRDGKHRNGRVRYSKPFPQVRGTGRQLHAVSELYGWSAEIYLRRRRETQAELRGFLYGHLKGMYPNPDADRCPRCKSPLYAFSVRDERFVCPDCGHKGERGVEVDPDAFQEGLESAKRPVAGALLQLAAPQEDTR